MTSIFLGLNIVRKIWDSVNTQPNILQRSSCFIHFNAEMLDIARHMQHSILEEFIMIFFAILLYLFITLKIGSYH